MEVIVITNQKGGVGKSTTAQSLAAALARLHGKSVLAIDADSQGSLTLACGASRSGVTLYDVISGDSEPSEAVIRPEGVPFDLIRGDRRLAFVDRELYGRRGSADVMGRIVESFNHDYVIIDAARGFEILAVSSLLCASGIVMPMEASYLSQAGLEDELSTYRDFRSKSSARWVRVLFTRYTRSKHATSVIEAIRGAGVPTFDTVIRQNVDLAAAAGAGTDIFDYAPRSNGAIDYASLANEVISL